MPLVAAATTTTTAALGHLWASGATVLMTESGGSVRLAARQSLSSPVVAASMSGSCPLSGPVLSLLFCLPFLFRAAGFYYASLSCDLDFPLVVLAPFFVSFRDASRRVSERVPE